MKAPFVLAGMALSSLLTPSLGTAQSVAIKASTDTRQTTDITEPGTIPLEQLFKMADVVATVEVVSGDTENYNGAIYKPIVLTAFKGKKKGETIYFGQYSGVRLDWEYTLFLRNPKDPAVPTKSPTAGFGTVEFLDVFNQGYSAMEGSYSCVFGGGIPDHSCDYGVRVCTDYIVLPKGVRAFPPEKDDPPFGCRWVRKSKFVALLDDLAEQPAVIQMPASVR